MAVRNTSKTVEHNLFWDATWCAGLEDPVIYSTQSHRKTCLAQFCYMTRGIDPYVPACTTQLYMCQSSRYPICGYQSCNGMLQDSEFKIAWGYFVFFFPPAWNELNFKPNLSLNLWHMNKIKNLILFPVKDLAVCRWCHQVEEVVGCISKCFLQEGGCNGRRKNN